MSAEVRDPMFQSDEANSRVGLHLTVEEVVSPLIEKVEGRWTKLSGTEWILTFNETDKVTNAKTETKLVFERPADKGGDVVFTQLVVNGQDAGALAIGFLMRQAKDARDQKAGAERR